MMEEYIGTMRRSGALSAMEYRRRKLAMFKRFKWGLDILQVPSREQVNNLSLRHKVMYRRLLASTQVRDRRPTIREMGEHPGPGRRDNYVHMDILTTDSVDKETLARMRDILAPSKPEGGD